MSQISNLRGYILDELEENTEADLVKIIARFDFYQHAIPTTNEMRQALKGLEYFDVVNNEGSVKIVKVDFKNDAAYKKITSKDMETTYDLYIGGLSKSAQKNT
ncbi:MAG: hypothetical protein [Olavius algarvensis Gamma 3 endosymbiont]|nr:MAG: hypothetical protein [Olavius algarvensis Gamma 3 endosymbiont]